MILTRLQQGPSKPTYVGYPNAQRLGPSKRQILGGRPSLLGLVKGDFYG